MPEVIVFSSPRPCTVLATLVAAGAMVMAATATPAEAAKQKPRPRPDLVVASVANPPSSAVRGARIVVRARVRNAARTTAKRSAVGFWLSTDRRRSAADRRVAKVAIPRVRKGVRRSASRRVRIPAATRPGRYYVIACADVARRIRESRERNNCRASRKRVTVTAPKPPVRPKPPVPPKPPAPPKPPVQGGDFDGPPDDVVEEFVRSGDAYWYPRDVGTVPGRTAAVTVDEDHAVTQTIDEAGGQIAVTTATGDTISLTVPKDALFGPVTITATPIASLAGASAAGSRPIGLSLAPDGLTMLKPAVMSVVPASGGVARPAVAVIGRNDGSQTEPGLLLPDADRLAVAVSHFSTASVLVASGTGGSGSPSSYFSPAEHQASLSTRMKDLIRKNRDHYLETGEDRVETAEELQRLVDEWYENLVRPKLAAMASSCAAAEQHVSFVLGSLRDAQLLGAARPEWDQEVSDAIRRAVRNCIDEMPPCQVMNRRDLARWFALARQLQLITGEQLELIWCHPVNGTITMTYDEVKDGPTSSGLDRRVQTRMQWSIGYSDTSRITWTADGNLASLDDTREADIWYVAEYAQDGHNKWCADDRWTDRANGEERELDELAISLNPGSNWGAIRWSHPLVTKTWTSACGGQTTESVRSKTIAGGSSLLGITDTHWFADQKRVVLSGSVDNAGPQGSLQGRFEADLYVDRSPDLS